MSLQYLLDGYNIVKRVPELAGKELEAGREGLVRAIEVYAPQGSSNNSVTIVFDGQSGMIGRLRSGSVKVVFTEGCSADDKIREMVEDSSSPKSMVVVTDDRDIKFAVRPMGATVLSVGDFWAKMVSRPVSGVPLKAAPAVPEDQKYISKTLEHKITAEFEKIWLEKKGRKKR